MEQLNGVTRWSVSMGHLDRAPDMGLLDGTPGQSAAHPENCVQTGSRLTDTRRSLINLKVFHVYFIVFFIYCS
jgi:hypothetical protein